MGYAIIQIMPRTSARERMLDSATTLLATRGVAGVTLDAVLSHSGAPRGSVYHHFPGGRTQLLQETVQRSGSRMTKRLRQAFDTDDPHAALGAFIDFWKVALDASDFAAGCPVAAVAMDGNPMVPGTDTMIKVILADWDTELRRALTAAGCPTTRVSTLSTTLLAAVEGAIILARAHHDPAPLDDVAVELDLLLRTALPSRSMP